VGAACQPDQVLVVGARPTATTQKPSAIADLLLRTDQSSDARMGVADAAANGRPPHCIRRVSTGAGEDHGIDHDKNWLRFPYVFSYLERARHRQNGPPVRDQTAAVPKRLVVESPWSQFPSECQRVDTAATQ
jgi:hypothetical protein